MIIVPRQMISLAPSAVTRITTPEIVLPILTERILVWVRRPTTLGPLAWDATGQLKVRISVLVDGVEHHCASRASGGVRVDETGKELSEYTLMYRPSHGRFGETGPNARNKYLGETARTSFTAHAEFILLRGSVETEVEVTSFDAPVSMVA